MKTIENGATANACDGYVAVSVPAPPTPMDMVRQALAQGAAMELVERFMAMHELFEANQARKAFNLAIAQAKAEITPVVRNATGHNNKKYADFAGIARTVDPIITKHGLSYRFRTTQSERISVTCVLSHELGHSEENTLSGPADKTGSKNDIQAIGSTLTYLQRYSLVQALGLAAANDDDGNGGKNGKDTVDDADDAETITDKQADEIKALLAQTNASLVLFLQKIKLDSLTQIRADKFNDAMKLIRDNAKRRKQQS